MTATLTRPDRTAQEIFDVVAVHLFTQRAPSVLGTVCAYRGEHGCKCAIGALIDDADYHVGLELLPATDPEVRAAARIGEGDGALVLGLQATHDHEGSWASPGVMRAWLARAAERYGVSAAVLTNELVRSEW